MRIAFVWQGLSQGKIYGHWGDGLRGAMDIIEKTHEVKYFEPWEEIKDVDIILYWEAPITRRGKDSENYKKIQANPIPKILLFAGGPVHREDCDGFDLFLVESQVNEFDFAAIGKPWMRAFGVDTRTMKPEKQPKIFDAVFPATCAGWKRHGIFARALGSKGVVCGRFQESDPIGFMNARDAGVLVLPELPYEAVNVLYNASWCCVNTSSEWGGGQRTTLEAMAAGIPVIVMSDSDKNCEYVRESGAGLIVDPDENKIKEAIEEIKKWTPQERGRGVEYVRGKWTHEHYAQNILKGIENVLQYKLNNLNKNMEDVKIEETPVIAEEVVTASESVATIDSEVTATPVEETPVVEVENSEEVSA